MNLSIEAETEDERTANDFFTSFPARTALEQ
jgi:hypothetical protein